MTWKFTAAEDKKLVEMVSTYPSIYDPSEVDYKNYLTKENLWREISDTLQKPIVDCKRRWRNIKDSYAKIKRRQKYGTGSAVKSKSKWPLLVQLNFLDNICFEGRVHSPNTGESSSEISAEILETTLSPAEVEPQTSTDDETEMAVAHKTERMKIENDYISNILENRALQRDEILELLRFNATNSEDPLTTFFKSIETTVRQFNDDLICEAKLKIFNIVHELEVRSLEQRRHHCSTSNN
ncbi:uncharacterized protein LOC143211101 [Lasioglossum baleicum]|uniref:uncharacterized protein LOC143211101 n=1 Tax=Lasioglossum baleicum TaxID=434251 RepID=UPI003FCCB75F